MERSLAGCVGKEREHVGPGDDGAGAAAVEHEQGRGVVEQRDGGIDGWPMPTVGSFGPIDLFDGQVEDRGVDGRPSP